MPKVKQNNQFINSLKLFLITTLSAVVIAIVLLVLAAFLLEKLGLNETQAQYFVYAIYLLTAMTAGIIAGKCQKERKFVWGALAGVVWFVVVFIASMCLNRTGMDTKEIFPAMISMLGGGMLGGMLA